MTTRGTSGSRSAPAEAMKTITITFRRAGCDNGKPLGAVTGIFPIYPGSGWIEWRGNLGPHVPAAYAGVTELTKHYAETFQAAMDAMAELAGLRVEVRESGDWLVNQDNVLGDAPAATTGARTRPAGQVHPQSRV